MNQGKNDTGGARLREKGAFHQTTKKEADKVSLK